MFVELFQCILSAIQHLQLLDPGVSRERLVLEDAVQLIGASREADAAEHVLLVSHIAVRDGCFLALVHLANLDVAFWSSHGRK